MTETGRTEYFGPLLTEASKIKREAVRRRKTHDEKHVPAEQLQEHLDLGWEVDKQLKRGLRIRRVKSIDERLENRFWLLLAKLGYPEINDGRRFNVVIERKGAEPLRKQVDVFAQDSETVVVAECKASAKFVKRSLQKDVEEFANLKGPIAEAIKKHYGAAKKHKIIWLFVTENIIWSAPDKERAAGANIKIVTERELRYYAQIADHLGRAARYQFLAEFLEGQKIPELTGKTVPAIKGRLGGKSFYCFVTTPRDLLKIAFVNHRSLNDPEGAPAYQRLISRSRLREVGEYLKRGGFFPNNLLVNFVKTVRFEASMKDEIAGVQFGQLYLPDRYRSAWIIDGQHRLYGFAPIDEKFAAQNLIVVGFENLPKQEEANLFVTINHEQKSVAKHLLDDLEGELKWGSEIPRERIGSISARLPNVLNNDLGEPFYNRIVQAGMPTTARTNLSIPALKEAIRKSGLVGKLILNGTTYDPGPLCGTNDFETLDRARQALNDYFGVIRNANVGEWENGRDGHVCTNVAVQAYIRLFATLIKYWETNTASDAREMEVEDIILGLDEYLKPILDFLESNGTAIKSEFNVPFGAGGPPEYYFRLCRLVKSKFSDFQPEGMEDWEAEQSEDRILQADASLKEIVSEMRNYIFQVLRSIHGEKNNAYWERGISDRGVKEAAYGRSLEYDIDDRLPLEAYLEVVEMKKIVENKATWPMFKAVFNIAEPGEKGLAKNLKWMIRINELRRIAAHPAKDRKYKVEDFEYIDFVHDEFKARLAEAAKKPLIEVDDSEPMDDEDA